MSDAQGPRDLPSDSSPDAPGLALNLIGGRLVPALSREWLPGEEPATGGLWGRVASSDARDVEAAVAAAAEAAPLWAALPAAGRGRHLRSLARLLERDLDLLAADESRDSGKPVHVARATDIPRAVQNFDFFADAATQFASESHATPDSLNYTLRAPLGVVACISPWNLPLYLLTWKIAPALAAGNTVVAKPSEITSLTAARLGALAIEAGLPPGVLNLIMGTGPRAGGPLCAHPLVKAISFTGSTRVGGEIALGAARTFKKVSLEMGGKNATVVCADADLDLAVSEAVRAAFSNQGQICLCGSRILVERPIAAAFKARLVARARALRVGDPREAATDQGALTSKAHLEKVLACLQTAREEGGRFLLGGDRALVAGRCAGGYFVNPTVIESLGPDTRTNQEEIFGPVVTVQEFDGDAQALALANATRYGLSASLFTRDLQRAHRLAAGLRAGLVWINCWMVRDLRVPFGGVGESGVGREGGLEAMRFFTEPKNVTVKL